MSTLEVGDEIILISVPDDNHLRSRPFHVGDKGVIVADKHPAHPRGIYVRIEIEGNTFGWWIEPFKLKLLHNLFGSLDKEIIL